MQRPPPMPLNLEEVKDSEAPKPKEDKTGLNDQQKQIIVDFLNKYHNEPKKHGWHQDWKISEDKSQIEYMVKPPGANSPGPAFGREQYYYGTGQIERDISENFSEEFKAAIREHIDDPSRVDDFINRLKAPEMDAQGEGFNREVTFNPNRAVYFINNPQMLAQLLAIAQSWKNDQILQANQAQVSQSIVERFATYIPSIANMITNLIGGKKEPPDQDASQSQDKKKEGPGEGPRT